MGRRRRVVVGVAAALSVALAGAAGCTGQASDRGAVTTMAEIAAVPAQVGAAPALLGPGTYVAGQHLDPGLYEVTVNSGVSAALSVPLGERDSFGSILEILSVPELAVGGLVATLRVELSDGDEVVLTAGSRGKFTLAFTPVVSRWIEPIDGTVTLHSGRWSVGEDLAPGRYVADVAPGARGFLSVDRAGIRTAMELLDGDGSDGGRPSAALDLSIGDRIEISGLNEVVIRPAEGGAIPTSTPVFESTTPSAATPVACDLLTIADIEASGLSVVEARGTDPNTPGDECEFVLPNAPNSVVAGRVGVDLIPAEMGAAFRPEGSRGEVLLEGIGVEAWGSEGFAAARLADGRVVIVVVAGLGLVDPRPYVVELLAVAVSRAAIADP